MRTTMPEPATAPSSGLFTTDAAPVPLAGVSIETEITAFCARGSDRLEPSVTSKTAAAGPW